MKYFLIISLILGSAYADEQVSYDLNELNADLVALFNAATTDTGASETLIGKVVSVDLTIKFASENHLLFEDGYIRVSTDTKYAFLKFERGMDLPAELEPGARVQVRFEILSTVRGPIAGNMPYLVVKLLSIRSEPLY